ncbi:hypothetical protein T492DRAFT_891708 [Pavlovales sp. CCMP2436]|nr:hypothetical protein T492DRAFT_891708 [Pavlovales sp. CCMP2436]
MVAKERDVAKEDITDFLIGISAAELVPEFSALLPMFVAPKSAVELVTIIEQLKSPSDRLTMFRSRAPIIVARSGILSKHFAAGTSSARQIEEASATINQDNKSEARHELWSLQGLSAFEHEMNKFPPGCNLPSAMEHAHARARARERARAHADAHAPVTQKHAYIA